MTTAPQSPIAVLIAEDEFLVRLAAVAVLDQAGFQVAHAGSAEEALPLLAQRADIAVLFTDINMPGRMNGLDLAFEVRRRWPITGLLLTSSSRPRDLKMLGGARFLAKPYLPEELVAGIKALTSPPSLSPLRAPADREGGLWIARAPRHRRQRF
ncbi:MAG TPA: response regulator [Dongiaceae bacterium]|jgi:CheY-like chemotaxis protein|nr:response regulator [Dongiaceae bacterium]